MITSNSARNARILTAGEERELIREWQDNKNKDALEELILSHARLVFAWSRRLCTNSADREELLSEGMFGVIRAVEMFDLERDVRFSTYARWWVKNAVLKSYKRMRSVIEMPATPARGSSGQQCRSLDEATIQGELVSHEPTPEEFVITKSSLSKMRQQIIAAMARLSQLEQEVLLSRSLKEPSESIEAIAIRLSLSANKVRQIERKAHSRLRRELMLDGIQSSSIG